MQKKNSIARKALKEDIVISILSQKDADQFTSSAKTFAATATTSKKKAQTALVSMGIYTASGRLSKKYG